MASDCQMEHVISQIVHERIVILQKTLHIKMHSGARLIKTYDVIFQRYRKSHTKMKISKIHIFLCMDSKFCVKFQRCPLKFHTKF